MGGPTMISVFNVRGGGGGGGGGLFGGGGGGGGGGIQVEVDKNARKAYEADYWKGLLDAQGKNDGTYY